MIWLFPVVVCGLSDFGVFDFDVFCGLVFAYAKFGCYSRDFVEFSCF